MFGGEIVHLRWSQETWRAYGYLFVGTYFGIYFLVLGSAYCLVRCGAIPAPDLNTWVNDSRVKKWVSPDKHLHLSKAASDFLTAWLIVKTTEPIRAAATIVAVPVMVRYLPIAVLSKLKVKIPASRLHKDSTP